MGMFDYNRVRMARQFRRLSMDQLVSRMEGYSISKMAISKIERGLIQPKEQTLAAIATACSVPVEYFYTDNISVGGLEFRFKPATPAKKRAAIEAQVVSEIQDYVRQFCNIPDRICFCNPFNGRVVRSYADVEHAARKIRKLWEIGLQPVFSVYELLQNYGILVMETDIDDDNVIGVSTFVDDTIPVVVINTRCNTTTERKRFTALHELAHLLLKLNPLTEEEFNDYVMSLPELSYTVSLKRPDRERLCETFAGAMLLPQECVFRRFGLSRSDIRIDELTDVRQTYGISIAATIHRLHTLRVIDDNRYNRYFDELIRPDKMETGLGEFPIKEHTSSEINIQYRLDEIADK